MLRQYELVERVKSYDPDADEALLNRAYVFSMQMHGSQLRASGDPYYSPHLTRRREDFSIGIDEPVRNPA